MRLVRGGHLYPTYGVDTAADPTAGGSLICDPNPVDHGADSTCTATANSGYTFTGFSGDCTGSACTLENVTAAKSVTAHFSLDSYAITTVADPAAGGSLSCDPNPVDHGADSTCTATANTGYSFSGFTGDCTGTACTLKNVTAAKSVTAHFSLDSYAITTAADPAAGGSLGCTPNPVDHGADSTCTATANTGYSFTGFSGDCTGTACTLENVTAARSVTAHFTPAMAEIHSGPTPTGSGTATVSALIDGGGSGCAVTEAGFVAAAGAPEPPAGIDLPHGLFGFTAEGCDPGFSITVAVDYPSAPAAGARYWKHDETNGWYTVPAAIDGNRVTFTVTDNGEGDADPTPGTIRDPGGIDDAGTLAAIPTLAYWAMLLLAGLLGAVGLLRSRRA